MIFILSIRNEESTNLEKEINTFSFKSYRLFFRPEQSGMSKVEAAVNTLRYIICFFMF